MKKIPTLFERDWDGDPSRVLNKLNPECEWVIRGEGFPTQKYDGTCVRVKDGKLWARFDAKNGKTPPPNFEPAQEIPDTETGHWPGWVPVEDQPQYKWHRAAWDRQPDMVDGTFELVGPHFQGNPEGFSDDTFIIHGCVGLQGAPTGFELLSAWFKGKDLEGIVWHHSDGRMAKIKKSDFGLKRKD